LHDQLCGRCCYFIRNPSNNEAVDPTKSCDNSILFGELEQNVLSSLDTLLSGLYTPLLARSPKSWGVADSTQCTSFKQDLSRFVVGLSEAQKNLAVGIDLRTPALAYQCEEGTFVERADLDPSFLMYHVKLLHDWCTSINLGYIKVYTSMLGDRGNGTIAILSR